MCGTYRTGAIYWGVFGSYSIDWDDEPYKVYEEYDGRTLREFTPLWTSHDILNEDGTVYLAASEPIPVYE
jgi:hypothetical protein